MVAPIYALKLGGRDHRLLWFLLAHQGSEEGVPTGIVPEGWRAQAMAELGLSWPGLCASIKRLRENGVIEAKSHQREIRIRGEAFEQ